MFLKRQEIIELTGYKYRNKQIRWLAEHGYKFDVAADGSPKVLVAFIEGMLGFNIPSMKRKPPEIDVSNSKYFRQ